MSKPRLLDLFCGAGGAAMGYHRAGFEVVGVDINPQPHYPFEFHQADAMTYPLDGFDAIHASPPCQPYSRAVTSRSSKWNDTLGRDEPALIDAIRGRLAGAVHVIENVEGAPLHGITLCGSMFGLDIPRHRLFETSWYLLAPGHTVSGHGEGSREATRMGLPGYDRDWQGPTNRDGGSLG